MSKEVDSLILAGSAFRISSHAFQSAADRIEHGMRFVGRQETEWADGSPITEEEANCYLAGAAFLKLGELVINHMARIPLLQIDDNPFAQLTYDIVDEISPFKGDDSLAELLNLGEPPHTPLARYDIADKYETILFADAKKEAELYAKSKIPKAVIDRRGKVAVRTFSRKDLQEGLAKLEGEMVAPDYVTFNDDLSIRHEKRDVRHLVARMGVQATEKQFPYYATFNLTSENNAPSMLADALMDLRTVAHELQQLQ